MDRCRTLVFRQEQPRLTPLAVQAESLHAATDAPAPDLSGDSGDESWIVPDSQPQSPFAVHRSTAVAPPLSAGPVVAVAPE